MTKLDAQAWLLEPDNPSVRYLALTGLLDRPADDAEVKAIQETIPTWGPARAILEAPWPQGSWVRPGVGYSPKHNATVWQVIFLAELGVPSIEAVNRACAYVLAHSRLSDGRFSTSKLSQGARACLSGALLRALLQFGHSDPRLEESIEALAKIGIRDGWRCQVLGGAGRAGTPCAWGAIKALGAFAELAERQRSPVVQEAIESGVTLLRAGDLATGEGLISCEPGSVWLQFGFPLGCSSDLLEALEVIGHLSGGAGPKPEAALQVVLRKRNREGGWILERTTPNSWADFGRVGQPNKWVTFRALQVLKTWKIEWL